MCSALLLKKAAMIEQCVCVCVCGRGGEWTDVVVSLHGFCGV